MASKLGPSAAQRTEGRAHGWLVLAVSGIAFLGTVSSPPALLDDVDAAYAQVARSMLESGDWVTARLNGVVYFDKPPGQVWAMALSFSAFGVHDWAARVPAALAAMALCWLAWCVARWAFGPQAGILAGVGLATCCGLFLFTRVRMPDVYVACTTLGALACFLRGLESQRPPGRWGALAGLCVGLGIMFKGLLGAVLPLGALGCYMAASGQWRDRRIWKRLGLPDALAAGIVVAAPWHVAAIVRHPPHFEFGLDSGPGLYRGFFWRYFINEHLLRFLGVRHPPDYARVNLAWFWAAHLVWLFPWSGLLAGLRKWRLDVSGRGGRTRLMMACACGFTLLFFSASTTQEYYTLPAYAPAMLLLASVGADRPALLRRAMQGASAVFALALAVAVAILAMSGPPPQGADISSALTSNPSGYTLSLGHFRDLTLEAFAHLRGPLLAAAAAFAIGAAGGWLRTPSARLAALAAASLALFHSAHWAMRAFEPHLSSKPLADAYLAGPPGTLVLDHELYAFSSLAFYANRPVLLLNGRRNNIEYGSNAPGAPDVFVSDRDLPKLWVSADPVYLATYASDRTRIQAAVEGQRVHVVTAKGDKVLLSNHSPHGGPRAP